MWDEINYSYHQCNTHMHVFVRKTGCENVYNSNTNKMNISERALTYGNLLHVSATHVAIFR
jgi:hypothetical protein